jgi:hypothetical protein
MELVERLATLTTTLAVVCFIGYVVALVRMPTGRRPLVTPVDRLGRPLPPQENPDYRDTEDEHEDP